MPQNIETSNVNLFLQVRLGSSRFPGKVLENINDKPLLFHICKRLLSIIDEFDEFVILTDYDSYDRIYDFLRVNNFLDVIKLFKGSENDVLDRFAKAIIEYPCENIVRATGDNIFLSRYYIIESIKRHLENNADYTKPIGLPIGTAIEVVKSKVINEINKNQLTDFDREHVLTYIYNRPELFNIYYFDVDAEYYYPNFNLTIDYPYDKLVIEKILTQCGNKKDIYGCIPLKNIIHRCRKNI